MANTLKQMMDYAKANPESDYAKTLFEHIKSGKADQQAQQEKIDLSRFGRPGLVQQTLNKEVTPSNATEEPKKKTLMEKIAGFTGGGKITAGLGQAMTMGKNAQMMDEQMAQAIKQQSEILKRRKEVQANGGDMTHINKALALNAEHLKQLGADYEGVLNPEKLTTKQVVGDALQLGTTVLGAGTLPGASKAVTGANTVGKGIVQGLKTGAKTGAIYGASTGVSQELKEDKSAGEIVKQGALGAITGAAGGAVLGGITGGIAGKINNAPIAKEEKIFKNITPDTKNLTPTKYKELLDAGKISEKTATKPSQYIFSKAEKDLITKNSHLIDKDPVTTINNLSKEMINKDKAVGTFLKKNNNIFNSGELKNHISAKLKGISDISIPEARITKLKKSMIDNFITDLPKNNMESLWKARKTFDRKIESAFSGSPTLQNTIKKEFRNAVQDFISQRTPNAKYQKMMKEMSGLFDIKDLAEIKAVSEKGKSAIQLWIKNNPVKAKALGWTATGIAGERILKATTGVGLY